MHSQGNARWQDDAGVISLLTVSLLTILVGLALAVGVIGRLATERRELQTAADSLAMAMAHSIEQNGLGSSGLPRNPLPALPFASANTALTFRSGPPKVTRLLDQGRTVVGVQLDAKLELGPPFWAGFDPSFDVSVSASAQVCEMEFGTPWPSLIFVLDASRSMGYTLLAANGRSAFGVLSDVVNAYSGLTLPVRNGLVIFNDSVVGVAALPATDVNNLPRVRQAFQGVAPSGRTNTRAALDMARGMLVTTGKGRNVVLVSDGEPTLGGACARDQPCHFDAGVQSASGLRRAGRAALFTVEVRRANYTQQASQFMLQVSGQPHTGGNNASMRYLAQSAIDVNVFIAGLTRSICAFGPLEPRSGAPADASHPRPIRSDLVSAPARIFALLRDPNGHETPIPRVANRDTVGGRAFEYWYDTALRQDWVILSLAACQWLGADAQRKLVVRWDDTQLVAAPG